MTTIQGFSFNAISRHTAQSNQASLRLASGQRINSSADDAAGLSISEGMRSQIRGMNQASQNAAIGQTMLNKADGVMGIVNEMLQRVRELKVQGANDTMSDRDRSIIAIEIYHLTEGIGDIARNTSWNGMNIFSPPSVGGVAGTDIRLQVGANSSQSMKFSFPDLYTNIFQALSAQNASTDWSSASSISSAISKIDDLLAFLNGSRAGLSSNPV